MRTAARRNVSLCLGIAWSLLISGAYVCGQEPHNKTCTFLTPGHSFNETRDHCFCYKTEWSVTQAWSTVRIKVQSTKAVFVSIRLKQVGCFQPENLMVYFTCLLHQLWKPSDSKQVYLDVHRLDEEFCFTVKIITKPTSYTVTYESLWFNLQLFALFLTGLLFFCFASTFSRTSAAFYCAGLIIGIVASPLLLLLVLKKYVSKSSTFWFLVITCCFLSAYAVHFLKENITVIWTDNKKYYVLGYCVTVGLLSFVTCYRHGPLCNDWSFRLFTWTLQIIACFLIYFGLALPNIAFTIIAVLVSCKSFCCSLKVLHHIHRVVMRKKPTVRLLSEDEYIEQAEVETTKALEELRNFCNSPDLNSWLVVSKLSSPKRFAEFILGASHVSSVEASAHEEQYGLGSCFVAEQLFMQERELQSQHMDIENPYTEEQLNSSFYDQSDHETSVLQ